MVALNNGLYYYRARIYVYESSLFGFPGDSYNTIVTYTIFIIDYLGYLYYLKYKNNQKLKFDKFNIMYENLLCH